MTKKSLLGAVLVLALALVASGAFSGLGQSATTEVKELPTTSTYIKVCLVTPREIRCYSHPINQLKAQGFYNLPGTTVYANWRFGSNKEEKLYGTLKLQYSCSWWGGFTTLVSQRIDKTPGQVVLRTSQNVGAICQNNKPAHTVRLEMQGTFPGPGYPSNFYALIQWQLN